MDYEVLEALGQITREKNVPMELVLETLEASLKSAAKKKYGSSDHINVTIDQATGAIAISATMKVVSEVEEEGVEISVEDARQIDPDVEEGDEVEKKLSFAEFGRNAIQAAKQILIQRIREAEREKIFEDYSERIGEIITGTVQQIDRGNIIVNLGRPEGIVPIKEQIRRERYRQGDTIRAYLMDVQKTTKGPQIVLSRTHPGFLEKLFELEVPEIYEKIVEIKAVAREAGDRSKVAVASNDARVDPVGACVGLKGIRVQNIVRELSNERIDIVPWSPDPDLFITKAISPAKVSKIDIDEREDKIILVVEEDQLSLAIGRAGQNVRLAAKLTGWKIDILSEEEYRQRQAEIAAMRVDITDLPGVGKKLAEEFQRAGVDSVQEMVHWDEERLQQLPGVGPATAEKLLRAANEVIDQVEAEHLKTIKERVRRKKAEKEEPAEEVAEAPAEEPVEAPEMVAARSVSVSKLRGIGPKLVQALQQAGIESLQDLSEAGEERLLEVSGVGPATAERLLKTAKEGMKQIYEAIHAGDDDDEEPADDEEPDEEEAAEGEEPAAEEEEEGQDEEEEEEGADEDEEEEEDDDDEENDDEKKPAGEEAADDQESQTGNDEEPDKE
jgi:N utilization substance protein A